jgi:hypothetical protein
MLRVCRRENVHNCQFAKAHSNTMLHVLQGRESGVLQQYSLPSGALQYKYSIALRPEVIALNSTST